MKKIYRGWFVLVTLALVFACCNGIMYNCVGIIFAAIIKETGYKASELSLFYSVRSLVGALCIGIVYKKFLAARKRNLFMCLMGVFCCLAFVMMTFFTAVWQWNIAAVFSGIGMCTLGMVMPIMINNWFHKHRGVLLAGSFTLSGILSAVFSPICSDIINAWGWRAACYAVAAIGVVTWIIPAYFFINLTPEEVGLKPYGSEDEQASAAFDFEGAKRYEVPTSVFLCVFCAVLFLAALGNLGPQLPTYATVNGYSLAVGATVTSFSMVSNFLFKLLMGFLSDRIGAVKSAMIYGIILAAGLLLILIGIGSPAVLYTGAFLYGCNYAVGTSSPALTLREVYGDAEYGEKLRVYQVFSNICGTAATFIFPFVYDCTGSWKPDFVYGVISSLICAVMLLNVLRYLKVRKPIRVNQN